LLEWDIWERIITPITASFSIRGVQESLSFIYEGGETPFPRFTHLSFEEGGAKGGERANQRGRERGLTRNNE
jgi:hypothetical protein